MPIVADASIAIRGDMTGFNSDLRGGFTAAEGAATKFRDKVKEYSLAAGTCLAGRVFGLAYGLQQTVQFLGDAGVGLRRARTDRPHHRRYVPRLGRRHPLLGRDRR